MSSVGIIFRENRQLKELPEDWIPTPLGTRQKVSEIVGDIMRTVPSGRLALTVTVEGEDQSLDPRTISVSGVWGDAEMMLIRALCLAFDARFYDAETAEFIEL